MIYRSHAGGSEQSQSLHSGTGWDCGDKIRVACGTDTLSVALAVASIFRSPVRESKAGVKANGPVLKDNVMYFDQPLYFLEFLWLLVALP